MTVGGHSIDENLILLRDIFERFRKANMKIKLSKCNFGSSSTEFLGHQIDSKGVKPLESKLDAIKNLTPPKSKKELQSTLGLFNWFRKYIPNYANLAAPLSDKLRGNQKFYFDDLDVMTFEKIKQALCQTSGLVFPDFNKPFVVMCDASDVGIGGLLQQFDNDNTAAKLISYVCIIK